MNLAQRIALEQLAHQARVDAEAAARAAHPHERRTWRALRHPLGPTPRPAPVDYETAQVVHAMKHGDAAWTRTSRLGQYRYAHQAVTRRVAWQQQQPS